MYYFRIFFLLTFLSIFTFTAKCQIDLNKLFSEKGEVYFKFLNSQISSPKTITRIISIDNLSQDNWIYAYANRSEYERFLELNIVHELLPHPGDLINPKMVDQINLKEINNWDYYPTYDAYVDIMNQFEENYPDLCEVFSIGTSIEGRQLMFAKISNNVNTEEGEARVLYTSSMHGDETTGYVLMLHLIDYLLANYNSVDKVTNMVDNLEIWINPLANPDGTYAGGNNTVQGATRFNANNIDLNRNYPDPDPYWGDHPDGNAWQKETIEFMELADSISFVLSANFHGGAEVFNYPWDTWEHLTADDNWWQYVGHEWADTAQFYSPEGYMDGYNDGITNGYQWYFVHGGRQDHMNYFHNCREVTLEISNTKLLPASQFPDFWEYNYRSFLNYLEQALFGIQGTVTDSISGEPVGALVFINDHDLDNSWVVSNTESGNYFRPLYQGVYDISFSAAGYQSKTISQVNVSNKQLTILDVELVYTGSGVQDIKTSGLFQIGPNPNNGRFYLTYLKQENIHCEIELFNVAGTLIKQLHHNFSAGSEVLTVDLNKEVSGIYLINIHTDRFTLQEKIIIR